MKLISELLKAVSKQAEADKQKAKAKKEKEIDSYGLEKWQKDLVRKDKYDACNFEEDDASDEDDYYNEAD